MSRVGKTCVVLVAQLLASCTSSGGEQVADDAALKARVDSILAHIGPDVPGCALGVYRDGNVVLTRSYGIASAESGQPITAQTTFNLGSAAKPFTAIAVLLLEEQGRLSLDDDVRRYVPELPDDGTPIRIRDLLQHTSGLRDYGTLGLLALHEAVTMPELLNLMASRGGFLGREVLLPLGMTGSRVHDARGVSVPERAFGHERSASGFRLLFPVSEITGGSNIYASVEDLIRWDMAVAEGVAGRGRVARLLARPTLASGDTIPYAFGIRRQTHRGLATLERSGHVPGARAEFVHSGRNRSSYASSSAAIHPRRSRTS